MKKVILTDRDKKAALPLNFAVLPRLVRSWSTDSLRCRGPVLQGKLAYLAEVILVADGERLCCHCSFWSRRIVLDDKF